MLYYSVIFLLVAVVSGILGFAALSGAAGWIAKTLLLVSLVMFFVSLTRAWRPT